jgi:membrane associated rhomboid family serine protease
MFLHADLLHILGNMFFLWLFGEGVEEALGHTLTAISYIACGVLATSLHYLVNTRSPIPCIGASGAISGMVGMFMALFPRAKVDLEVYVWRFHVRTISTNTVGAIGAWLGEQAVLGVFASATGWSFGVAFMAHVGGLLAGIGLGLALTWSGVPSHYSRMVARKASGFMFCPSCGRRGPRLPAGGYRCRTCGAKLHVDEARNLGLVEPSKTGPSE